MSTLTCSVFLKRHCLMPYMDGQYLISDFKESKCLQKVALIKEMYCLFTHYSQEMDSIAHGPFLDLVETSKLREGKMDLTSTLPVRTGVFPKGDIRCVVEFNKSRFLLAITSEINSDYRTVVSGCLIHRSTLLTGGYVKTSGVHTICEYEHCSSITTSAVPLAHAIPSTNEFVLLTGGTIGHYRYLIDDKLVFSLDTVKQFDLKTLIDDADTVEYFSTLSISPTSSFEIIIVPQRHMAQSQKVTLLKYQKNRWISRTLETNYATAAAKIPDLDVGIICGQDTSYYVSTKCYQGCISNDDLKIISTHDGIQGVRSINIEEGASPGSKKVFLASDFSISIWTATKNSFSRLFIIDDLKEHIEMRSEENSFLRQSFAGYGQMMMADNLDSMRLALTDMNYELPQRCIVLRKSGGGDDLMLVVYDSGFIRICKTTDFELTPEERSMKLLVLNDTVPCRLSSLAKMSAAVHMLPHNEQCYKYRMNVVSIDASVIDFYELDAFGTLVNRTSHEIIEKKGSYDNFCSTAAFEKELNKTPPQTLARALHNAIIHNEGQNIEDIYFYKDEISANSRNCFVFSTREKIRIFHLDLVNELTAKQVQMLTVHKTEFSRITPLGDGASVQDVLVFYRKYAFLSPIRNDHINVRSMVKCFIGDRNEDEYVKEICLTCSTTARTLDASTYCEVIFFGKQCSKLGVITIPTIGDGFPCAALADQWSCSAEQNEYMDLHVETGRCSFNDDQCFEITVRLYALDSSGTLHISSGLLTVGKEVFTIAQTSLVCTIHSAMTDASRFVMRQMHPKDGKENRIPPKYAIISGRRGSEVVRICQSKWAELEK